MTKRTCDACTECCKGWVTGNAHGHYFYPGKPCFYLQKNCTIYENRPDNPCKSFECHWLATEDLPMWFRPDLSKVLVVKREIDGVEYFSATECGEKMDSSVLSWLFNWALSNNLNFQYQVNGGFNRLGSPEFLKLDLTKNRT